ncbi:MAG: hypothetical protein GXO96_03260 [Nitrospirae bacterium]|nr:hypothetical protein [Candidatus Manganitrophaceae bacterium]
MPLISPFVLQFAFLKYLDLIGIVVFMGLFAFRVLVFLPTVKTISDIETREALKADERKYTQKISVIVILYLIVLQGVILVHQIENLTGRPMAQSTHILSHWLTGTFSGLLWMNKVFLLIFMGLLSRFESQRKDFLFLGSGILLCLIASLGGHAFSVKIYALVITDLMHLIAVTIWVGALLPLTRTVRRYGQCVKPDQQVHFLRKLVEVFSLWAMFAVAIIIISGGFNLGVYLGDDLFSFESQYAKVFLLKFCFVLIVFASGALARFYILPRLQKKEPIERTSFLRLQKLFIAVLSFELFFVTGVLILAALLTQTEIPS